MFQDFCLAQAKSGKAQYDAVQSCFTHSQKLLSLASHLLLAVHTVVPTLP
jgi:hypothetical protein